MSDKDLQELSEELEDTVEDKGQDAPVEPEESPQPLEPETPEGEGESKAQRLESLLNTIRESSYQGELVKLSELDFGSEDDELDPEELKADLLALEEIKTLSGKTGETYLYSSALMVDRYANTVLYREENDPISLVAETVREESYLYPRPTMIRTFTLPPYKIPESILDTIVQELIEDEGEYADIQVSVASTGARYLYSTRHMQKAYADYLTEWYEVGQHEEQ